jgi:hypothetical protein
MSVETSRARRLRRDLRFLRVYSAKTNRMMRYKPHRESVSASEEALAIADRIEGGLAGEARRYRMVGWCMVGVIVGPVLLAGFLWSGMYWLPVILYWWPFDRGNYGLPFLSLFEWLAYLMIAAYFVVAWALLSASHAEALKLGTEYRRLLEVSAEQRAEIAAALEDGAHPRARFVVRNSPVLHTAYAEFMAPEERS